MARDNDIMNVFDAAALLGVHVQTLRKLARQKRIPAFKVGRDWKFSRESIVDWTKSQHSSDHDAIDCSVVVIDDDEQVCKAMAGAVTRLGCRARQATGGAAGLELIAQEVPDVVLLDLKMPGMSGPQVLAELRVTHPTLPVVIVTGYPDSELMMEAMLHGPVLLVPKPVHSELLDRTVRLAVGKSSASRY